jgi:putative toxin-antitoxin system antitoxin component (TIGR02293 family)
MNGKLTRATEAGRVSELLGLSEDINDYKGLVTQIAKGLPTTSVENILEVMNSKPVSNLIPERAYRRAKSEQLPLSVVKSQILYDFARAYVAADRVHDGNGAMVMRFLEKPHPDLGGAAPITLAISSPIGADVVIELLSR